MPLIPDKPEFTLNYSGGKNKQTNHIKKKT